MPLLRARPCAIPSSYGCRRFCPPRTLASPFTRAFSASTRHGAAAREPNCYEVLDVPITATQAEIKKKFYALSLRHHPDRNRDDPTASQRFARISAAYNILGNHTKRATYDRDHGILAHHKAATSTHSSTAPGYHPMGSHSSYGHGYYASANVNDKGASYAGSRPASGLSKRKGAFRGPPPSFYAHGGYGNHARGKHPHQQGQAGPGASAGGAAGAGKKWEDADPTSFIDRNNVYHFNARGHYRTQTAEDNRREERRSRAMGAELNDQYIGNRGDFAVRFVIVCVMLAGAVALTGMYRAPSERAARPAKVSPARKEE